MSDAIRIQVAIENTLVAEAIVADYGTANRLWAHFAVAKYQRGQDAGGAIIQRADSPRHWDVPVGSEVPR